MSSKATTDIILPFDTGGLTVLQIHLGELKPYRRNARTHSKKQTRQIADSIREFGFTNPVLIDRENTILAGHGRVEAAKLLGLATVPCLRIEHMTDTQKRAYILADNKIALNAGWDETVLAEELKGLMVLDPGFDLGLTGFSIPEVDELIEGLEVVEPGDPREDKLPDQRAIGRAQSSRTAERSSIWSTMMTDVSTLRA